MISKTAQYALRAVVLLAAEEGSRRGAQEIAERIGAPPNYMGKLLKQLAASGVVESSRGSGGGFRLARPASDITLYQVVEPIDRVSRWGDCFLGTSGGCSTENPCPIHPFWKPIRERYLQMLETLTVATIPADRGDGLLHQLFAGRPGEGEGAGEEHDR